MDDKTYYLEKLKFLMEAGKQLITVFLTTMAGLKLLFRMEKLTTVDRVFIAFGSVINVTTIILILIFVLGVKILMVLNKIRT